MKRGERRERICGVCREPIPVDEVRAGRLFVCGACSWRVSPDGIRLDVQRLRTRLAIAGRLPDPWAASRREKARAGRAGRPQRTGVAIHRQRRAAESPARRMWQLVPPPAVLCYRPRRPEETTHSLALELSKLIKRRSPAGCRRQGFNAPSLISRVGFACKRTPVAAPATEGQAPCCYMLSALAVAVHRCVSHRRPLPR